LHFVSSFLVLHQGMAKDWPGFWRGSRPAYPRVAIPEPVVDKRRLMVCIIFFMSPTSNLIWQKAFFYHKLHKLP